MSENGIEIERKGWEIVPYVLREIVPYVPNPNYFDDREFELFHGRVYKIMNEAIKESRDRARIANDTIPRRSTISQNVTEAIPVSTLVRSHESLNSNQPTGNVGRRKSTIVVESVDFSVAVPKNFPDVDIDKLRVPNAILLKRNGQKYDRRFTFAERLRGWNFERRLRIAEKNHLDSYYLHYASNVKFRSFVEIVNFLLYEEHSKMFKKPKAKVDKSETLGKRKNSGDKSTSGRKPKKSKVTANNPSVDSSFEVTIQEAEEFLSGFENFGKEIGSSSKGKQVDDIKEAEEIKEGDDMDSEETVPGQVTSVRNVNDKGKSVVVEVDDAVTSEPKNDNKKSDTAIVEEAQPSTNGTKNIFLIEEDEYDMAHIFGGLENLFPNCGFVEENETVVLIPDTLF